MTKKQVIVLVIILIVLAGSGVWYLQSMKQPSPKPLTDIRIDPGHNAASTLLMVAKDEGYFAQHGLNVTFVESSSTIVAMQNLLNHKNDFGFFHDYVLSEPLLYNTTIRVIGTIAESDTNYVVARKDRGIVRAQDLEGKKIGVTRSNAPEYFMDRFFILNGMSIRNTTVIYMQPADLVNAIVKGDIDATFSPEPYVYQMRQKMGDNAVVWPTNLKQHQQYSLVCNEDLIREHPEIIDAMLSSVIQAEIYVNTHPEEAKKIAQNQTKFDDQYMDQDWPNHRFSVGLSQSLITSMEDETRWRMANNMTDVTEVPDFLNYIAPDPLYKLKPASVTIIR